MRRILTPIRYERRLHSDNQTPPMMIAHRAYTHLMMPVADDSPDAEPITASGRVVRGDNQGRLLLDRFRDPYTELVMFSYKSTVNTGPALYAITKGYKRVFLHRPIMNFLDNVWYCQSGGARVYDFYKQPPYEIKETPLWFWVESQGMPGFWFYFDVIYLR